MTLFWIKLFHWRMQRKDGVCPTQSLILLSKIITYKFSRPAKNRELSFLVKTAGRYQIVIPPTVTAAHLTPVSGL